MASSTTLSPATSTFWNAYLASLAGADDADRCFYETFRIGDSDESAAGGARLILQGEKTATSSLLWDYEISGKPLPVVGSLSIVEAGADQPACIVETIELEIRQFSDIDEQFARDYGEWDRTLATWRRHCWQYYSVQCVSLGKKPSEDMPLVCERFRVVFP